MVFGIYLMQGTDIPLLYYLLVENLSIEFACTYAEYSPTSWGCQLQNPFLLQLMNVLLPLAEKLAV